MVAGPPNNSDLGTALECLRSKIVANLFTKLIICFLSYSVQNRWSGSDRDYNPSYTIDDHPINKNDQISDNYNTNIGHSEESDHFKDSKSSEYHPFKILIVLTSIITNHLGWSGISEEA